MGHRVAHGVLGTNGAQGVTDQPLPHDLEAERALLGIALIKGTIPQDEAVSTLQPGHFFRDAHRIIFRAMRALQADDQEVDLITLKHRLDDRDLDRIGGAAYVAGLTDGLPRSMNPSTYATMIREHADARSMLAALERARTRLYRDSCAAGNGLASELADELDAIRGGTAQADRFGVLDDQQIRQLPQTTHLIDKMITDASLNMLYGESGLGKTTLSIRICLSVNTGRALFGAAVPEPGNTLHVLAEGRGALMRRLQAARLELGIDDDTELGYHAILEPVDLLNESDVTALITLAKRVTPKLISIDTLSRCMSGSDSDTGDMGRLIRACDRIRQAIPGAAMLLLHHPGWDSSRERGAYALRGAIDSSWRLQDSGDGQVRLVCEKNRDGELFPDIYLERVPMHGSVVMRLQDTRGRDELSALDGSILAVLPKGGLSKNNWVKKVQDDQICHRGTAYKAVERLIQRGHVTRSGSRYVPQETRDEM